MGKPTIDDQNFICEILDKTTPGEWLSAMRYFLPYLIRNDQRFLVELIGREAERRAKGSHANRRPADDLCVVFGDLGLKVVLDETGGD